MIKEYILLLYIGFQQIKIENRWTMCQKDDNPTEEQKTSQTHQSVSTQQEKNTASRDGLQMSPLLNCVIIQ